MNEECTTLKASISVSNIGPLLHRSFTANCDITVCRVEQHDHEVQWTNRWTLLSFKVTPYCCIVGPRPLSVTWLSGSKMASSETFLIHLDFRFAWYTLKFLQFSRLLLCCGRLRARPTTRTFSALLYMLVAFCSPDTIFVFLSVGLHLKAWISLWVDFHNIWMEPRLDLDSFQAGWVRHRKQTEVLQRIRVSHSFFF